MTSPRSGRGWLLLLLIGLSACAAGKLGDAAPRVASKAVWIKGSPVAIPSAAGPVVVEFWATWCQPCRRNIVHMTRLQERLAPRGVRVVGVSNEDPAVVRPFVEAMGSRMNYAVVADPSEGTWRAYMDRYRETGIPHAFIVDQRGRVAWHGYPGRELERTLESMLAGHYDIQKTIRRQQLERQIRELLADAAQARGAALAEIGRRSRSLLADASDEPWMLLRFASGLASLERRGGYHDPRLVLEAVHRAEQIADAADGELFFLLAKLSNGLSSETARRLADKAVTAARDQASRHEYETFRAGL